MKRTLQGACILVLTLAAYQGVSTFIEHTHLREFNHATTIAKVTRFGASRRTRLDVWFGTASRSGNDEMEPDATVMVFRRSTVRLDVTSGKKQLRYHFSVHLQKTRNETTRSTDSCTRNEYSNLGYERKIVGI